MAMRILIACDKFKGTLSAADACAAIALGIRDAMPDATIDICPMSDGGEGFVDAMTRSMQGERVIQRVTRRVTGPLPEQHVDATFAIVDSHTAIMEMSSASGLALLAPADRNPLYTTSFGTGELIRHAAELGCRRVILGIGGSATCDAGVGCLQACGCHIILASGGYGSMSEPICGRDLDDVLIIKSGRGSPVDGVEISVACDVSNPLYGPTGTAEVFGPQKGASSGDVRELDRMLVALSGRLGWDAIATRPRSGAAGGIGCGLAAMYGATLRSGVDIVIEIARLEERMRAADIVITGEGCLDATSINGKVVVGVATLARKLHKLCVAIVGQTQDHAVLAALNPLKIVTLVDETTSSEFARNNAAAILRIRAFEWAKAR